MSKILSAPDSGELPLTIDAPSPSVHRLYTSEANYPFFPDRRKGGQADVVLASPYWHGVTI